MQFLKGLNLLLAFLLELGMFFSISYWGYTQGKSPIAKWTLAIFCLALTITLWGILAAPNSGKRLAFTSRLLFELTMFLLASLSLYKLNFLTLSICFAVLSLISVAMAFIFKQ